MTSIMPPSHQTRWTLRDLGLLAALTTLLTLLMSGYLNWANDNGVLPVKPRDLTVACCGAAIFFIASNRTSWCLPALAMLSLPVLRFMDAGLLERFTQTMWGDHPTYVMQLAANAFVAAVIAASLATPKGMQIAVIISVVTILLCTASNLYEWLGMATYTRIPGRVSGWLVDPNASPIVICLLLGIVLTHSLRFWWNMLLLGISAVGVSLPLSRSGAIIFWIMTICYVVVNFRAHKTGLIAIISVAIPVGGIGLAVLSESAERRGTVRDENAQSRVQALYELDFEKLWSGERAKDLRDGWEAAMEKPVFGHGTGAGNTKWQPHNQFVAIWDDLGICGVLLYAGLLIHLSVICAKAGGRGFACLIPLWGYIPFSQVLMETSAYWYCATVCACAVSSRRISITWTAARRNAAETSTSGAYA